VYGLSAQSVAPVQDPRRKPRLPLPVLLKAGLVMFWFRRGSLNALEEHRRWRFWQPGLGRLPAGADTLGRVYARLAPNGLRQGRHHLSSRLKRNKALPSIDGLEVAVVDGQETPARYRRPGSGCLQRTIHTEHGEATSDYHRNVTLPLPTPSQLRILRDLEPPRPGEDEVTTALRLWARVPADYPRAFGLRLADGLYAQAPFIAPPASTEQAVRLGHGRGDLENYGFNEWVNQGHSDHVYKHHAQAIESFLLLAFLAYNLFHAFRLLHLKPQIRHHKTQRYWVRLILCEFCRDTPFAQGSSP